MSSYISYFRPEIDSMAGYAPGEQPKPGEKIIKLNTNESPFPPAPGVSVALKKFNADYLRLYPDPVGNALRAELAVMNGYEADNILIGNGSDDLLTIITRCFTDSSKPLVCFDPSYSLYPALAQLQGASCIRIPLTEDFQIPEDVLKQASHANAFFIARPNAPTGTLFPREKMEEICAGFNGIVLIDEAYADFAKDNCMDFVKKYSNVIIMRTFSKSRSLAGLRFGYAVAHKKVVEGMIKMKDSYNVSMTTQALALASLYDRSYFENCVAKIKLNRETLTLALRDLGFKISGSETNFVFAEPPIPAKNYFQALKKKGILVRYFSLPRTCRFVRITVGSMEEIHTLLEATKQILDGE